MLNISGATEGNFNRDLSFRTPYTRRGPGRPSNPEASSSLLRPLLTLLVKVSRLLETVPPVDITARYGSSATYPVPLAPAAVALSSLRVGICPKRDTLVDPLAPKLH